MHGAGYVGAIVGQVRQVGRVGLEGVFFCFCGLSFVICNYFVSLHSENIIAKTGMKIAKKILKWGGITLLLLIIAMIAIPFFFKDTIKEKKDNLHR